MSLLLAYVGYALKLSFLFIPQVFILWGFLFLPPAALPGASLLKKRKQNF